MSLKLNFRAVGVFCYLENLELEDVSDESKVKDIMNSIVRATKGQFSYESGFVDPNDPTSKEILTAINFDFRNSSKKPPNASAVPVSRPRRLANDLAPGNGPSLIWQYYRSATGVLRGERVELRIVSPGQPSFARARIVDDFRAPNGFKVDTYNLTWRLLRLYLPNDKLQGFRAAEASAVQFRG